MVQLVALHGTARSIVCVQLAVYETDRLAEPRIDDYQINIL